MRRIIACRLFLGLLLVVGVASTVPARQAQAAEPACDRGCLQTFVDQYLKALVAHDPYKAGFGAGIRITENGQRLGLGFGLWKTASADSTYRLYFAEPATGEVGFIGVLKEVGLPVIVAVRLKVEHNQIMESETIVSRPRDPAMANPAGFRSPNPLLTAEIPPAQRASREDLIRIDNSYFTGLDEEDSGKNVPFDELCQRRENGIETARSSDPKASAMAKLGCKAQFDTGFSAIVTAVRERRFPVVDVERGLVFSVVFFDHAGNVASYKQPDGTVVPINSPIFRHPMTLMIGELFRIQGGKIRQIEAVLQEVPYRMPSGWGEK
jgi:hypothetical protein